MVLDRAEFLAIAGDRNFYRRLRKSLLPLKDEEQPRDKRAFLNDLYDDVRNGQYFPAVPRGYIVSDKHNRVARIAPVFSYRDSCVYYFCVKKLEGVIAGNRVKGTFGGWALGNPLREQERQEQVGNREDEEEMPDVGAEHGEYFFTASFDPLQWTRNWGEYQRLALIKAGRENLENFVKFDIANFYDSVDLDLLERKIRAVSSPNLQSIVDLLFVFLRNWNRQFQGYGRKSVGLPQDETGDCSRLLANFYLQDYDAFMSNLCTGAIGRGEYLRYSDDQIVMTQEIADARLILFNASKELHKIGLNINSGKVIEFADRADYDYYWAFELFELLDEPDETGRVNEAARRFVERVRARQSGRDRREWRIDSVTRRIISVGLERIEQDLRADVVAILLERDFIVKAEAWMFEKMLPALTQDERRRLFETIDLWVAIIPYNAFHLNVLKFYQENVIGKDIDEICRRLEELRYV